jgi:hypothetical protein
VADQSYVLDRLDTNDAEQDAIGLDTGESDGSGIRSPAGLRCLRSQTKTPSDRLGELFSIPIGNGVR